jgi:hypothetical protein
MTRAQYEHFCTGFYHLASDIGIRPACRALGISESKGLKIAWKRKWHLSKYSIGAHVRTPHSANHNALESVEITQDVKRRLLEQGSTRTKLALSQAAVTATEHLAGLDGKSLMAPTHGIAADTWSRTADRVHGWQAERQKPLVQIANVSLPTPEERAERQRAHDALDAIARKLGLREG